MSHKFIVPSVHIFFLKMSVSGIRFRSSDIKDATLQGNDPIEATLHGNDPIEATLVVSSKFSLEFELA